MHIEEFRSYCLSLEGAEEKMPFARAASEYDRNMLVFHVHGKWFCFVNIDAFDFCTMKCAPERIFELQARYDGIQPGYHMNKRHWISIRFDRDVPDELIRQLVKDAHSLTMASSL